MPVSIGKSDVKMDHINVKMCGSVTPDGSTLTLLRLSPEDSGTYTCLAVSPAGQESKIYTLFVLGQFQRFIVKSSFSFSLMVKSRAAPTDYFHF